MKTSCCIIEFQHPPVHPGFYSLMEFISIGLPTRNLFSYAQHTLLLLLLSHYKTQKSWKNLLSFAGLSAEFLATGCFLGREEHDEHAQSSGGESKQ